MDKNTQKQYLIWLDKNAPGLLREYERRYGRPNLGEAESKGEKKPGWLDKLFGLATAYTQFKTQKDILKAQTERMKRGQPPLNTDQYGMPPIRVETGLTPTARADSKKMIYIGIGLFLVAGGIYYASSRK